MTHGVASRNSFMLGHNLLMAEKVQLRIRIDPDLRDRLQREADYNRRSFNAEILHRLEVSLDGPRDLVAEKPEDYDLTDGERSLLEKLRRLTGQDAGTAAAVIDALAVKSVEPAGGSPRRAGGAD